MLRAGAILLSLWATLILLSALVRILFFAVFGIRQNAPALLVLLDETSNLGLGNPPAPINALTVLCNASLVAACGLSLTFIWTGVIRRKWRAFFALLTYLGLLQAAAFVSDEFLGNRNLATNIASAAVLLLGFGLAACG